MTSPLRDAESATAGVPVVRGLEWQESNEGYAKGQWFARSIFGEYCTYMHTPSGRAWLRGPDSLGEFAGSIKEAQAVAQNHFERLGREIINPDFLSELDTARAEIERLTRDVNKYAYERDKAREERDAAERRSEAFWKPQVVRLERLEKLVRVFLDNNPDEAVADSGETVLDLFRHDARATLSPVKENDRG